MIAYNNDFDIIVIIIKGTWPNTYSIPHYTYDIIGVNQYIIYNDL
jgi:hypothetical protein